MKIILSCQKCNCALLNYVTYFIKQFTKLAVHMQTGGFFCCSLLNHLFSTILQLQVFIVLINSLEFIIMLANLEILGIYVDQKN